MMNKFLLLDIMSLNPMMVSLSKVMGISIDDGTDVLIEFSY